MERQNKIIHNRIRCKNCGEIIESKSRHDWVCCKCWKNEEGNKGCFVDGGHSYIRIGGDPENYELMIETRPFTDEERDEYNRHQELIAEQYGWTYVDYME